MMRFWIYLFILCIAFPAMAHKPSDSYLRLVVKADHIEGEWAIALRDLELVVGLDGNFDGKITWGELKARQDAVASRLSQSLKLENEGRICPLRFGDTLVDEYSDGHYALMRFSARCDEKIESLTIDDQFLFDLDAQHKSLISLKAGDYAQSAILSTDLRKTTLSIYAPNAWKQLKEYTRQGMWHIWLGFDHLLFLIALLLPAAWIYRSGKRRDDMPFKIVFWEVFGYISAFTLAHAITLGLAMYDVIHIRSRIVESLIALTIVISCINNLKPFLKQRLWLLTFGFGLIHGMGFATTLSELGLTHSARWLALLGFNLGVELGQLVIVAILLPIFYTIRQNKAYDIVVVKGFSLLIMIIAGVWFYQRATGIIVFKFLRN